MRKILVRISLVVIVVVITSVITNGCINNPTDTTNTYSNDGVPSDDSYTSTNVTDRVQSVGDDEQTDSENSGKTILTMAAYSARFDEFTLDNAHAQHLKEEVGKFNNTNPDYYIEFTDYSQFDTEGDSNAGLMRLTTEITSGKIPDIMEVSGIPFRLYAAKGMFADLYPLIDADPKFSRSDFVESAFRAAEINGCLYQIFPSFHFSSIFGHPSVVGTGSGWDMYEFEAMLDAHPEANLSLGYYTDIRFLQDALEFSANEYIDWTTGTVHFDSIDFIRLLEVAGRFPSRTDLDNMSPENPLLDTRHAIMYPGSIHISYFPQIKLMFGEDYVVKGFPSASKGGSRINLKYGTGYAITENSENKEAAWEFLRLFLYDNRQNFFYSNIPTNRVALDKKIEEALRRSYDYGEGHIIPGQIAPDNLTMTDEDIEKVLAVIDSLSGITGWDMDKTLWNIVSEEAMDYFNSKQSAADAARIIQSRVSILVSERS